MPNARSLALRREALAELATDELAHVAGAAPATPSCPTPPSGIECPTAPVLRCVTEVASRAAC